MTQNAINTSLSISQYLYTSTNSVSTLSTPILRNDTIPINTDGDEVITLSITPKSATSILIIQFDGSYTNDVTCNDSAAALFQDSTVNALAAIGYRMSATGECFNLIYSMTSGTTSSTTFKIRCGQGSSGGGPSYLNADTSGNRLMGGVCSAFLSITEYL